MGLPGVSPLYPQKPIINPVIPQTPAVSPYLKREIEYVKGYDGASNYPLAPNSSVILPDQDMPVVWVVMTDANGNKNMIKGYKLGDEYVPPKPVTMEDLMAEIKTMNERLMRVEGGKHESDSQSAGENGTGSTGSAAGTAGGRGNEPDGDAIAW